MARLLLLGIGTARSPRFAPAGLLVEYGHARVGLDGGPGSEPPENVHAWLVADEHGPLRDDLRRIAHEADMLEPAVAPYLHGTLHVDPLPVAHPRAGVHGYKITRGHRCAVWAPDFVKLPDWAEAADLVFAGADNSDVAETAEAARRLRVKRLVFVCLGDKACSAMDAGETPPFGEWGVEGGQYRM
ncbi:hypothetical protein ACGFNU_36705 [Spirillospora sp. NPDC048911]|uniref:hypothetical protein n=1 Tax=Spirillospora sp. NPDC048911 TaxID=3364527 RepID=UPI003718405A